MRVERQETPATVGKSLVSVLGDGWLRSFALGFAALLAALTGEASAQDGIVAPGYAVVSGFSGTLQNEQPAGEDPADYLTIDFDGPAANVIDLTQMGTPGELTQAPKVFTVTAAQVGQVFGVALDLSLIHI